MLSCHLDRAGEGLSGELPYFNHDFTLHFPADVVGMNPIEQTGIAFFIAVVISFFAILFTRKYPRRLFDFNVGVLRWGWRVGFYGYSARHPDKL